MTATRDLRIVQGVEFAEQYTWTSAGVRQSLTGLIARAHMRSSPGAPLLFDFTPHLSVVDGVTIDGSTGQAVELRVPADQTRLIVRGGVWDLFLTDIAGGEQVRSVKLLTGAVTVTQAVTEDA